MDGIIKKIFNHRGQSIIEVSLIVLIATSALAVMSPMLKRGLQGMIKVAADQIGSQKDSDQNFEDGGSFSDLRSTANTSNADTVSEELGVISYTKNDYTERRLENTMNYGIQEK